MSVQSVFTRRRIGHGVQVSVRGTENANAKNARACFERTLVSRIGNLLNMEISRTIVQNCGPL